MIFKSANVERIFKTLSVRNRHKGQAGVRTVSWEWGKYAGTDKNEVPVGCSPSLAVLSRAIPLLVLETPVQ